MKKIFNINNYRSLFDGNDCTPAVLAAINDAQENGGGTIVFDKGEYHFYEKHTLKHFCDPYGSPGIKSIAFPLIGVSHISVDGGNSDFIFHGLITPFVCEKSKNITLHGFTLSYNRPFHTEIVVKAVNDKEKWFDGFIDQKLFPTHITDGRLNAYSPYMELSSPFGYLVTEYDGALREPAYDKGYYVLNREKPADLESYTDDGFSGNFWVESTGENTVRIHMPNKKMPKVGNVMTFLNDGRQCCSIIMHESENISLSDIDILDCGAMSIVGQMSKDISLDSVRVRLPKENEHGYSSARVVSCTADATHFVNCMGKLSITDCVFENMLDDGTNIHGIYNVITERISSNTIASRNHVHQTFFFRKGDTVSFLKLASYSEVGRAVITSVTKRPEKDDVVYTFDREIPDVVDTVEHYVMDNMTTVPTEVYISNVVTGNNRPRGFLIATQAKVVIEDCTFHSSSSGIFMQPFGYGCLESQGVEDVTIRRCRFVNCGYADDCAAILISPNVKEGMAPVHKNVSIYDCIFESFGAPSIEANNTQNLQIYNNTYIHTTAYPQIKFNHQVILKDCNL
ncbi:MAG: right-handed parallel beta-helix repeat-containing protein [Ruminococcaceae bacterium]|nr:right-handed parallel beta-helix repeat-containing protein [Oscillospiraceae bacterium]